MKETPMNKRLIAVSLAAALSLGAGGAVLFRSAPAAARDALIYKSPTCGCCKGWATYLERNGYRVTTIDRDDMDTVKDGMGVPEAMRSCHTAKIEGYVVEGHVPLEAIDKLLAEKPKVKGIAAPGMPSGSPGMSGSKEPNPVFTFGDGGTRLLGTW
jgi:hypothetical protein